MGSQFLVNHKKKLSKEHRGRVRHATEESDLAKIR